MYVWTLITELYQITSKLEEIWILFSLWDGLTFENTWSNGFPKETAGLLNHAESFSKKTSELIRSSYGCMSVLGK